MADGDKPCRVLLILREREDREAARDSLRAEGYEVYTRESPIGATVEIVRARIDVVVVDIDFDVMSGDRFAELIRRNDRLDHVGLVLCSEGGPDEARKLAQSVGADAGLSRRALAYSLPTAIPLALGRRDRRTSTRPPPPNTMAVLVLRSDRFALPLIEGRQLIGRDASCRFMLNHPSVSRQHAAIEVHGARAHIEDLGSHNGTAVNGVIVSKPEPLELGDVICFGEEELVLSVERHLNRETVEMD